MPMDERVKKILENRKPMLAHYLKVKAHRATVEKQKGKPPQKSKAESLDPRNPEV